MEKTTNALVVQISNNIALTKSQLPTQLQKRIIDDLTIENPAFTAALRQDRSTYNIPKQIKLYDFDQNNERLLLPRGYGKRLMQLLKADGTPFTVADNRLTLPAVDFGSKIKLRDYQAPAVDALVKHRQGGIAAPCGSGKTAILLETMARIGQPALWVTHTIELLNQGTDRAVQAFDIDRDEIGIIAGGKVTVGPMLTLALIQTLAKADIKDLAPRFGAVFVDEAHHLAARSFFHPIGQFPALYRLWASATPERSDGLTEMVFAAGGPVLHTIEHGEVPVITPRLVVVETGFTGTADEYTQLISDLIQDQRRNGLIVRTISAEAPGNYSLVLSDRTEHLTILRDQLTRKLPGMEIALLTGSMGKKDRLAVMGRVQNRQVDILLATQLAREGLDITHLNRLFLCTPKRATGAIQQEVGRVMRPCEGKVDAAVFDFWDSKSPMLKAQFWKRREAYRKVGIEWVPRDVRRCGNWS